MDKRLWASRIQGIKPYVPGEQPVDRQYIKLNTNENPYPPSEKVLAAMHAAINKDLRLYPEPTAAAVRKALAARAGVKESQVFMGNGSDEVLSFCFAAFTDDETPAVFPDITYSFYPVYATLYHAPTRVVPLNEDFTVPIEEFSHNDGCIFLANPNAPTGLALTANEIEQILQANPDQVVIVDEAYVDFGGETVVPLIDRYENLLVVQTMSKSRSLAGLRVGFAFGCESMVGALDAVKNCINSFTVDRVAIAAATAAVEDEQAFQAGCRKICATRERVKAEIEAMGLRVVPSSTNFLLIEHPDSAALAKALKERGVLIRYFALPRIDTYIRVTIGTDEEMDVFLREFHDLLGK